MRAGGFTVQQALTTEAASVIKQAVTLARRRGHAQVTPLHVASTMLSSPTGLLRTACLQSQSHSHPLQCKALELCFNVALNRLPASSSSPMLSPPHSHHPSISNALVAAFKRAQAHQRRGSIENQQQPLLAVKIELEQLIISILDDPSVSRVMREAGFSSTLVKTNVEQTVSLELCSQNQEASDKSSNENNNLLVLSQESAGAKVGKERGCQDQVRDEDVTCVIESLLNKRRKSLVIVGENVMNVESVVRTVKDKVDKGDVPEALREVKFISLPLFSFENLSRGKVEQKLEDLRSMKSFVDKGLVLYLGDLKWITEYRESYFGGQGRNYYCPVEHMIIELGRLAYGIGESGKFWFMGIASFQTYMKCKTGYPSLESVWRLHLLTVPSGALALSLLPDSDVQKDCERKKSENGSKWLLSEGGEEKQLTCCADCTSQFEIEARNSRNTTCHGESTSSSLPSWLRDESKRLNSHDQDSASSVKELCKKWNKFCSTYHKQLHPFNEKTLTYSSAISPSSSTSCFSYDRQNPNLHSTSQKIWPVIDPKQSQFMDHQCLRMYIPENGRFSTPNSTPNSASSSDIMEMEYVTRFKEFNTENLNTICNALEKKVPWQKDIIHEIAGTILQCRSGMLRRKEKSCNDQAKEETWFFFQGVDAHAKEKVARELARVVFGSSHSNFVTIALSSFSSTRADSTEDLRNKRSRDEQSCSYIERFAEAVSVNPHRVFLVEDIEQSDYCSQMGMKKAIESGRIRNSSGEEVSLGDSIVILSCESFSSRSRACSPPIRHKINGAEEEIKVLESEDHTTGPCISLDLNMSFADDVDDEGAAEMSIDDIGLLESVDRLIVFKIQEL
ncbi:Clp R domain-containing protein [Heracleum sosnowskyi]|uniref:Clp R domain-containing protein n=1 Tax=Heracleum sosnowskyi TaxID=360622 RepID=A0AAD8NDV7_9APIA|nr:Clp R domain-containing protein [Heracleum sosnowskyi]